MLRIFYAPNREFRLSFFVRRLLTVMLSVIVYRPFGHNKPGRKIIRRTAERVRQTKPSFLIRIYGGTQKSEKERALLVENMIQNLFVFPPLSPEPDPELYRSFPFPRT
jgi:hypothetical protein